MKNQNEYYYQTSFYLRREKARCYFIITNNRNKLIEGTNKLGFIGEITATDFIRLAGHCIGKGLEKGFLIWCYKPELYVIVHELVHMGVKLSLLTNYQIKQKDDEPFAYLISEAYEKIEKYCIKNNFFNITYNKKFKVK